MPKHLTLQEINTLDQERFVMALGSLFEGSPWIAKQAWHARPFESLAQLYDALCTVMYHAPVEQQMTRDADHGQEPRNLPPQSSARHQRDYRYR